MMTTACEARWLLVVLASAFAACGPIGGEASGEPSGVTGTGQATSTGQATGTNGAMGGGNTMQSAGAANGAGGTGSGGGGGTIGSGGDGSHRVAPGGYYVAGANVFKSDGTRHRFRGLSRPSLEWNSAGEHFSEQDFALMGAWNANVVRLPLNQAFWLPGPRHAPGYERVVDLAVQWAEGLGMDVILDLHWSNRGDANASPAQQRMADRNSIAFWSAVAEKYKGDGRILFELYNEPHDVPWEVWRNGGPSGDGFEAVGMQQLHDAVRSTGAHNLVIVGGVRWAFDLSTVGQAPIVGYNVLYATHPYDHADKQAAAWDGAWGYLTDRAPVMVTEFGSLTTCSGQYNAAVIAYAEAHNASWIGWAWYPKDCSFPSLVADWQGTPTAAGTAVKTALSSN